MDTGAELSECGTYRYLLWRIWNHQQRRLAFIMLNPSTASYQVDDPTIRRCMRFAGAKGYGGIIVANLFAYRCTDPSELPNDESAIGPDNDAFIRKIKTYTGYYVDVCFAWGTKGAMQGRDQQIIAQFPNAYFLERTKEGHPKHPLYIRSDAQLQPFISHD